MDDVNNFACSWCIEVLRFFSVVKFYNKVRCIRKLNFWNLRVQERVFVVSIFGLNSNKVDISKFKDPLLSSIEPISSYHFNFNVSRLICTNQIPTLLLFSHWFGCWFSSIKYYTIISVTQRWGVYFFLFITYISFRSCSWWSWI